jgi:hypothetical protein
MDKLLLEYIKNPKLSINNFNLGVYYESIKQYASAITYYLRSAEYSDIEKEKDIIYESLLKISICFNKLGNRPYNEKGWILHAISFIPKRPEAYFLLTVFHEKMSTTNQNKEWQESYTTAIIGRLFLKNAKRTITNLGYYGEFGFEFQKAVAAWWVGRVNESRNSFLTMPDRFKIPENYIQPIQNNLNFLGAGEYPILRYNKSEIESLRYKFSGAEKISRSHSQVYQDMFVLSMLNGKENGYYLEIGAAHPINNNNTYLLETVFNWKGVSIEINEGEVKKFREIRKNSVICKDATTINYENLLNGINAPNIIDYLQLDCDPHNITYEILLSIPFETHKFAVITYEHDYYMDASRSYRQLSRKYLESYGYKLIVGDIAPNDKFSFEDWWVHPDFVDSDIIEKMIDNKKKPINNAKKYMFKIKTP